MTAAPYLTIVVPAYKRAAQLPRLLDSVLAHAGDELELVVVDDASPDDTAAVVAARAAADPRVRLVRHAVNGGVHAARNSGMDAARGRWTAFLDADDYLLPGAPARVLERLREAEAAGRELAFFAYCADTGEPTGLRADGAVSVLDLFTGKAYHTEKTCLMCVASILVARSGARWYYLNLDSLLWRDLACHARVPGALSFTEPVGVYDTGTEGSLKKLRRDPAHARRHAAAKVEAVLRFLGRTEAFLRAHPDAAAVAAGFYLLGNLRPAPYSAKFSAAPRVLRRVIELPLPAVLRLKLLVALLAPPVMPASGSSR